MSCLLKIFLFGLVIFYVVFHLVDLVDRGILVSKLEGIIVSVDEDILLVSVDASKCLDKYWYISYFMKLPIFSLVGFQMKNEENERLRKIKSKVKKERFKFKKVEGFAIF